MTIKQRLRVLAVFLLASAITALVIIGIMKSLGMDWQHGRGQLVHIIPAIVFGVLAALAQEAYEHAILDGATAVFEIVGHERDVVHIDRCAYCGKMEALWNVGEECKIRKFVLENNAK